MNYLKNNLKTILERQGRDLPQFLTARNVSNVDELKLCDLKSFCEDAGIELVNLLCYSMSFNKAKSNEIKLVILDVDGVLTDGGMYFSESGDQQKKYNTKDGMGIMQLHKEGIQLGIISSGFKAEMVKARADLLKIEHFYVGREPKIDVLQRWCKQLKIYLSEVAIIGDDINDLSIIEKVGVSAAPSDAVDVVKAKVDIVLTKKGGDGCVREFIDYYLLKKPISNY